MRESRTITATIFMAGSIADATDAVSEYYSKIGGCVTITPTKYVYTGGVENGFAVGFINYPPYPVSDENGLMLKAAKLAEWLVGKCGQQSYTIQGPTRTITWGRDIQ